MAEAVLLIFRFVVRCVAWYVHRCWVLGCQVQFG